MLPRWNRLKTADEFRHTVRRGRRVVGPCMVAYVSASSSRDESDTRFGFIVSKKVGGAVVRNTVRRRLRAACASLDAQVVKGYDVVFRVLPPAATQPYPVLCDEVTRSLAKGAVLR